MWLLLKYIASVSFGKDSLAMLLLIIENKMPLDEVVFYDTGMEFRAIYNIRDKVKKMLDELGVVFTELKPAKPFEESMYNTMYISREGKLKWGYGWCGAMCRWGTTEKVRIIKNHVGSAHQYVGIAKDEPERLAKLESYKSSPLADLGFTEEMALKYCYSKGYNWLEDGVELYSILDRVSCWCCRNKNLKELQNYKKHLPTYYQKLKELEELIGEPMKKPKFLKEREKQWRN